MSKTEIKSINKDITKSCREDYREYIDRMIGEMEDAVRITKKLSYCKGFSSVMPSKDLNGEPITSTNQLLATWNEFLTKKFASPDSDMNRSREQTASN